jgi:hypothetical protein
VTLCVKNRSYRREQRISFLENLALISTAATILGIFLTVYAIINNKTFKKESRLTREVTERIIKEENRLVREIIKETTEYLAKYLGDELNVISHPPRYTANTYTTTLYYTIY